ncbi:MAG: hypothetical protein DWI10_10640 [Planctomycetota bacterium]|nr:MAG: hypothetical protein DWI10_10640 [Planctomycetota bacterium]
MRLLRSMSDLSRHHFEYFREHFMRRIPQASFRTLALTALTSATLLCLAASPVALAPLALAVDGAPLPSTLSAPKIYVFPMEGQMGTDISPQLVDIMIKDIKKQKPDILVMQLKSADIDRNDYLKNDDPKEFGKPMIEEYRDMVRKIHEDLPEIPQIMWVEDSVGFSSLIALGWPNMYMKSDARLWGLQGVARLAGGWTDPDVAAKMLAAWTGIGKGIIQIGGYPLELGDAMIFPERLLSVKFDGRTVAWLNDTTGVWIVDGSNEGVVNFEATIAEDTLLSDGTADSLDDLMFLLGYREYTQTESGPKLAKQYVADWRKALERCEELAGEIESMEPTVQGLTKAKGALEKILAAMKQYPAVQTRLGNKQSDIEIMIDNIKKDIQRAKDAGKGNGGSGGGGNSRGLGGGGMGGRRPPG